MGSRLRHCFIVFNLETCRTMLRLLTIFALSAILITISLGEPQDLQLVKENEKQQISMNNSAEEKDSHWYVSSTQGYGTFEPFIPCNLKNTMAVLSTVAKIKKSRIKSRVMRNVHGLLNMVKA